MTLKREENGREAANDIIRCMQRWYGDVQQSYAGASPGTGQTCSPK